jgi:hypothetical protein
VNSTLAEPVAALVVGGLTCDLSSAAVKYAFAPRFVAIGVVHSP